MFDGMFSCRWTANLPFPAVSTFGLQGAKVELAVTHRTFKPSAKDCTEASRASSF